MWENMTDLLDSSILHNIRQQTETTKEKTVVIAVPLHYSSAMLELCSQCFFTTSGLLQHAAMQAHANCGLEV
ncbi:hypothetical protein MUK42_34563 [Musa troglodytarum]|uniref:Uncharacterized protein n=1 Tax=Musa troglodytarum TaxID=320322 RepID=A0A9E7E9A4_9LILI|nr:hypothetical protein MUK42_34563 [Musa troglodytarum]